MGTFKGFDSDVLFLLSENEFNNSKEHYESVRELLKKKAAEPMRQICADLSEQLFELDEKNEPDTLENGLENKARHPLFKGQAALPQQYVGNVYAKQAGMAQSALYVVRVYSAGLFCRRRHFRRRAVFYGCIQADFTVEAG